MGYVDTVNCERIKADIELQPLPACARGLVDRLLYQEWIEAPTGGHEQEALRRLLEMGLVEMEPPDWDDAEPTYVYSFLLEELSDRGLLDALIGEAR